MKRYTVNVHYDVVVRVEVCAGSEDEAMELAELKAENIPLEMADSIDFTESCITDEANL